MQITFLTTKQTTLANDDNLLIKQIKKLIPNITININSFLDQSIDWKKYHIINLKTAYGYYQYPYEFTNWLKHIKNLNKKFFNPIDHILWNMDKFYLKELEKNNIQILPTIFIEQNETINLAEIIKEYQWQKIVIKPSLSAGGNNLFLCDSTNKESLKKAQNHISRIQKFSKVLIQEYNNSIAINGEYSAIFIDGEYCYLIHKKPKNKFIASYSQGIEVIAVTNQKITNYAKEIFRKISILGDTLYTRIDLILDREKIYLMELELIEPRLFFDKVDHCFMNKYIKAMI